MTADGEDVSSPMSSAPTTPPEDDVGSRDRIEDVTEETLKRGVTGYAITGIPKPKPGAPSDPRAR